MSERAQEIPQRQRHQVKTEALCAHVVVAQEHQTIGEQDGVVEERLRHHQREAEDRARAMLDAPWRATRRARDVSPRVDVRISRSGGGSVAGSRRSRALDLGDDALGFLASRGSSASAGSPARAGA